MPPATRPSVIALQQDEHHRGDRLAHRKAGWTKASPMKPPSGSTSSFTIVAISEERSRRNCGSGKRSSVSISWKRMRRSMRSPSRPLKVEM